jgi:hypothetical protein
MITKYDTYIKKDAKKILYAFDLDDTLLYSERFEKQVKYLITETLTIEDILKRELKKINSDISNLKYSDGRIYIDDKEHKIEIPQNSSFIRKGTRVYLQPPESFLNTKFSLPINSNDSLLNLYNSVGNKCIITARKEKVRHKIEEVLNKFNIEYPNFGLFMFTNNYKSTAVYKSEKILKVYTENNFEHVNYYDDDIKLLKRIKAILQDTDISFTLYKVEKSNLKKI